MFSFWILEILRKVAYAPANQDYSNATQVAISLFRINSIFSISQILDKNWNITRIGSVS